MKDARTINKPVLRFYLRKARIVEGESHHLRCSGLQLRDSYFASFGCEISKELSGRMGRGAALALSNQPSLPTVECQIGDILVLKEAIYAHRMGRDLRSRNPAHSKYAGDRVEKLAGKYADGIFARTYRRIVPDEKLVKANEAFVSRFDNELDSAISDSPT